MKKLFWILLLGNVILFAEIRLGWFTSRDQTIVQGPPLNEQMILLQKPMPTLPAKTMPASPSPVASEHSVAAPAPVSSPVAAPVSAPVQTAAISTGSSSLRLSTTMVEPENMSPKTPICIEWGDFSGADLVRAKDVLAALRLGDRLSSHQMERDIVYWVYIPPLNNKTAVNKKIGELKELGVREYFVVQNDGRWHNTISMGVFKSREAAENFLGHLRTKGVRSARVGERASKLVTTVFRVDKTDTATSTRLAEIQKDFPGSELKNVPCVPTSGAH